jgi:hypothetical protein
MRAAGLLLVERNWRCRHGEIDLIAEERGMLVFAEVRMRSGPGFGGAGESVTAAKRQRLLAAAVSRAPPGGVVPLRRLPGGRDHRQRAMDPRRFWGVVVVIGTMACAHAQESVRLLVQNSPLAGFRYHAAAEVWRELRIGDRLELLRDPDNPHDAKLSSFFDLWGFPGIIVLLGVIFTGVGWFVPRWFARKSSPEIPSAAGA